MSRDQLLTTNQIAEQLNVSQRTVRYWCQHGLLKAINIRPGGARPVYRVRESTVNRLLEPETRTERKAI